MTRLLRVAAGALFVLPAIAVPAWADITLYVNGTPNVVGNSSSAPGFGTTSWQAAAVTAGQKSELYLSPTVLFGHSVTIGDIASISYWTDNPAANSSTDWGLLIYTNKQAGDPSWYHTRLNAEPYLTGAGNPAGVWTEWSTNDPSHPLRFYDANRDGGIYGTYGDPTLAEIQGTATLNWHNFYPSYPVTSLDYAPETISYFSWQTGSGWANGFTGLIDGLDIQLKNGEDVKVNLEAVPEPSAILFLVTTVAAVGFRLRRRR